MAIRINENIFSLLVNRNLVRAGNDLEGAYSRLSSGERITQSGDDPAGLANSHLLRSKITGLQRVVLNANQGLNLLGVAESALGTETDILQRLRELAIQSASAIMDDDQRNLIQREVDQLLEELERIATTTNYNEKNLLDGTFTDMSLQVGTREGEVMQVSIASVRISVLGALARVTGALPVNALPIAGGGDLTMNGVDVPATEPDGVSTVGGASSAWAKAAAINAITYLTGVTARAEKTEYSDPAASVQGGSLDGSASSLTINGVNIGAVDFVAGDSDNILLTRINAFTSATGVEAAIGSGGELVLRAVDGRNVEIVTTGSVADELGLAAADSDLNLVARGEITLISTDTIQVGGDLSLIGLTAGQATSYVDTSTAIENLTVTTMENAQEALLTLDAALEQILAHRASLGALESRLTKTIDDVMVHIEKLTGADSRIRDADFAVETTNLTQAQIIQQAGIAILAQANMVPQMALSLLER